MSGDIAGRLRQLRQRRNLTTVQMAEMTGIPKRTLDTYLREANPAVPGGEALEKLGRGLRVSLDWLALGEERTPGLGRAARSP